MTRGTARDKALEKIVQHLEEILQIPGDDPRYKEFLK